MAFLMPSRGRLAIGVAAIIALFVVGGLVWGFTQQVVLSQEMRTEEIRLAQAVATEQVCHNELTTLSEYVESDEYVECWAREEAKMAKPGEVVVLPVATDEAPTLEAQPEEPSVPEPRPFWAAWWELLFGSTVGDCSKFGRDMVK